MGRLKCSAQRLIFRYVSSLAFQDVYKRQVLRCEEKQCAIEDLSLAELQEFCPVMEEDLYDYIDYKNILKKGNKKEML